MINFYGVCAIYKFEMTRMKRTLMQSVASPVISTALYFLVFGSALGRHMVQVDGVNYDAFIVPGMIMLALLTQSLSNAAFGIYMPRYSGTIYEVLSAPISYIEILLGYVGGAASKSLILGAVIFVTSHLFVSYEVMYPGWAIMFLILTSVTFSLFGFIIGVWADSFEKLQIVPLMVITPLAFLGGSFYPIKMLSPFWQTVSLFNPAVYLISGFRWSFFGTTDVNIGFSLVMTLAFLVVGLLAVRWIFKTGYRLKQ